MRTETKRQVLLARLRMIAACADLEAADAHRQANSDGWTVDHWEGLRQWQAQFNVVEAELDALDREEECQESDAPLLTWLRGQPSEPERWDYTHALGADGRHYILYVPTDAARAMWSNDNRIYMPNDLWPDGESQHTWLPLDDAKAACEALERRYREGTA